MITTALFGFLLVLTVYQGGSITKFSICSGKYAVATVLTLVCISVVVVAVYKFTVQRQEYYKSIKYIYTTNFAKYKNFALLLGGATGAGLLQGLLGMGSGHMISLALLNLDFLPEVVSGTSGFLVAYTTLAALIQEIAIGRISLGLASMFFALVFVVSLVGTFFCVKYLKSKANISNVILLILGLLCVVSILGVAVNIGMTVHFFGFQELLHWRKLC